MPLRATKMLRGVPETLLAPARFVVSVAWITLIVTKGTEYGCHTAVGSSDFPGCVRHMSGWRSDGVEW